RGEGAGGGVTRDQWQQAVSVAGAACGRSVAGRPQRYGGTAIAVAGCGGGSIPGARVPRPAVWQPGTGYTGCAGPGTVSTCGLSNARGGRLGSAGACRDPGDK